MRPYPSPEHMPIYVALMAMDQRFRQFMKRVLRPLNRDDLLGGDGRP